HPASPVLHPLSLHDALPIWPPPLTLMRCPSAASSTIFARSEPAPGARLGKDHQRGRSRQSPAHAVGGVLEHDARSREPVAQGVRDRKSTRLNSSHVSISYAV